MEMDDLSLVNNFSFQSASSFKDIEEESKLLFLIFLLFFDNNISYLL